LLDLIVQAGARGATLLFSSHQIGDIERTAGRIAILNGGRLACNTELAKIPGETRLEDVFFEAVREPEDICA
jgi:ABC-type multidrug transport system ATPase subunit